MNVEAIISQARWVEELRAELRKAEEDLKAMAQGQHVSQVAQQLPTRSVATQPSPEPTVKWQPGRAASGRVPDEDYLPKSARSRVLEWIAKQTQPVQAYHACKELGINPRLETRMMTLLANMYHDGLLERVAEGKHGAPGTYAALGKNIGTRVDKAPESKPSSNGINPGKQLAQAIGARHTELRK